MQKGGWGAEDVLTLMKERINLNLRSAGPCRLNPAHQGRKAAVGQAGKDQVRCPRRRGALGRSNPGGPAALSLVHLLV